MKKVNCSKLSVMKSFVVSQTCFFMVRILVSKFKDKKIVASYTHEYGKSAELPDCVEWAWYGHEV